MTKLEYNYRYVQNKRNGYHGAEYSDRQLANSVRLSTYEERYDWPSPRHRKAIIGLCLVVLVLLIGAVEMGLLDGLYVWLVY